MASIYIVPIEYRSNKNILQVETCITAAESEEEVKKRICREVSLKGWLLTMKIKKIEELDGYKISLERIEDGDNEDGDTV